METAYSLALADLVSLEHDVVPYIMDWPQVPADDGEPEAAVLVVLKRPGGFLAAVPVGFMPEEVWANGNMDPPPGVVGPSTVLRLPGMVLDNGVLAPAGSLMSVVVVDLNESVVAQLRPVDAGDAYPYTFDADQPFAVPHPQLLITSAREWAEASGETSHRAYLSVEEAAEGVPVLDIEEQADDPPVTPRPAARRRAKAPAPGPERPMSGAKRPTVATLASSMEQLLMMNEGFTKNLESLTQRQIALEKRVATPTAPEAGPSVTLRQPISSALMPQTSSLGTIAQQLGTPPRTLAPTAPGLLGSPLVRPNELQELEDEKREGGQSSSSDPLAQAVLAQSQALTALVAQIAEQSGDPMLELSTTGASSGTRGAQGRARLQAELAAQKGSFFTSVLAAMSRRMCPTMSPEGSPQELMDRGICGTRYLERFGGYGKVRELGCLQYQVMSIMDCLQTQNWQAARDQTALLAVTLDQAALDSGKFDLAQLLCLQEEPPSTIFTSRQGNILAKPRAFSPLADQKWVTVALAYIKELDVITSKRLELTSQSRQGTFGNSSLTDASPGQPKAKPAAKKKAKGGGRGGQNQPAEADEA